MEASAVAAAAEEGVPPVGALPADADDVVADGLQEVVFTDAHRSLTLVTQRHAKKTDGVFGRTAVCTCAPADPILMSLRLCFSNSQFALLALLTPSVDTYVVGRSVILRGGIHHCDFTVLKGRKLVVGVCTATYDPHCGPRATHSSDGWGCHTLGGDFCHGAADGTQAWPKWPGQAGVQPGDKLGLQVDLSRGHIDIFKNDSRLGTMVTSNELIGQDLCWMVEIEGVGDAVCVGVPMDAVVAHQHIAARRVAGVARRRGARDPLNSNGQGLGLPPLSVAPTLAVDPTAARLAETHPQWVCPITGELMVDPVVDPEGHTWEREAVSRWLELSQTSPLTRSPRTCTSLHPDSLRMFAHIAADTCGAYHSVF